MSGEAGVARTVHASLATGSPAAREALADQAWRQRAWLAQQAQAVAFAGADTAAYVIAMTLAFLVRSDLDGTPWTVRMDGVLGVRFTPHIWGLALILLVLMAWFASRSHYTERVPFWTESRDVVCGTALALFCDLLLKTAIYRLDYTLDFALRWIAFVPIVLLCRVAARRVLSQLGLWRLDTLIIGPTRTAERIAAALNSQPGLGYRVVGAIEPSRSTVDGDAGDDASPTSGVGCLAVLRRHQANFLAIVAGSDPEAESRLIALAHAACIPFALVPACEPMPIPSGRPHYFLSHDVTLLPFRNNLARPVARMAKLAFDLLAASLVVVLCAPLLLAIALLVRLDGGPAIFRHRRIGAGGRPFLCMKFRTMHVDADARLTEILANDPAAAAEWAATQKLRNDPRITPIGHVLRKTSLDELPQLFNVLRREMSLVGPRPIVTAEVGFYGTQIGYYFETRPGITGLWQVSGRSDTSYPRRVQLDVWYVRNWTLWHDVAILLKTVPAVLLKRGAV